MSSFFEITLLHVYQSSEEVEIPIYISFKGVSYSIQKAGTSIIISGEELDEEIGIGVSPLSVTAESLSFFLTHSPSEIGLSDDIVVQVQVTTKETNFAVLSDTIKNLTGVVPGDLNEIDLKIDQNTLRIKEMLEEINGSDRTEEVQMLVDSYSKKEEITGKCIEDLNSHIENLKAQLETLTQQKAVLMKELVEEQSKNCLMKQKLTELQISNEQQKFSVDFNLPTPPDSLSYLQYIQEFDTKIKEFKETIEELQREKTDLLLENSELKARDVHGMSFKNEIEINKLRSENGQLEFQVKSLTQQINSLQASLDSSSTEIRSLKEQMAKLEVLNSDYKSALEESEKQLEAQSKNFDSFSSSLSPQKIQSPTSMLSESQSLMLNASKVHYEEVINKMKEELKAKHNNTVEVCNRYEELMNSLRSQNSSLQETASKARAQNEDLQAKLDVSEKEKGELLIAHNLLCAKSGLSDDLNAQVNLLSAQLALSENRSQEFVKQLSSLAEVMSIQSKKNHSTNARINLLSNEIMNKDIEIARLRRIISKYKTIHPNYVPVQSDPIDVALAEFINNLDEPLDVQFVREDSGIYFYGNKRVFVKVEASKIILRIGGGYMRIEEFISLFTYEELYKLDEFSFEEKKEERAVLRNSKTIRDDSKIPMSKRGFTPSKVSTPSRSTVRGLSNFGFFGNRQSLL